MKLTLRDQEAHLVPISLVYIIRLKARTHCRQYYYRLRHSLGYRDEALQFQLLAVVRIESMLRPQRRVTNGAAEPLGFLHVTG